MCLYLIKFIQGWMTCILLYNSSNKINDYWWWHNIITIYMTINFYNLLYSQIIKSLKGIL